MQANQQKLLHLGRMPAKRAWPLFRAPAGNIRRVMASATEVAATAIDHEGRGGIVFF
jgi:hypothetical protein